jgi:nucleotide-binding universal stress UspA family protein
VRAETADGSPAAELIAAAERFRADLVVVGSHGRTALGRLLMGSVSQRVLTEAGCSVRVARGRVEVEPAPARIVVGVDGSQGADAAVRAVGARRWPLLSEARVVVAQTLFVPTIAGGMMPPVAAWAEAENETARRHARLVGERAAAVLAGAELITSIRVADGDPERVLVEEAESWGADSIFVGSHGATTRVERFLLGSVSATVAARARCTVEVVRDPRPAEAA